MGAMSANADGATKRAPVKQFWVWVELQLLPSKFGSSCMAVSFCKNTYCTAEGYPHMWRLELAVSEVHSKLKAALVIIWVLLHYTVCCCLSSVETPNKYSWAETTMSCH